MMETAIVIGMVQVLFPFMVPSILGVVMRIDPRLPVLASSIYEAATKTLEWHFAAAQSIILPVVVAGVSFTAGDYVTFPPQGLSPRWYEAIMSSSVCTLVAGWKSGRRLKRRHEPSAVKPTRKLVFTIFSPSRRMKLP